METIAEKVLMKQTLISQDWSAVIELYFFLYVSGQHATSPNQVDMTEQLQISQQQHIPENLSPYFWDVWYSLVCNLYFLFITPLHNFNSEWHYAFCDLVDSL